MIKKIIFFVGSIFFLFNATLGYCQGRGNLENAITKVAVDVGNAVVSISSIVKEKVITQGPYFASSPNGGDNYNQFFEEFFGGFPEQEYSRMGLGSGVIIDKNGFILTNEHVVSGASEIKVKLADGREFDAVVKGIDKRIDLAVIKINASNLSVAKLGASDNLLIGQWVVAIGNPFGFAIENPEPTATVGIISALHRYVPALGRRDRSYDDLIQTDAAINPGNSGGPLVNLDGEVIGVNTAIITTSGGYQGIGFATPIDKVKRILPKMMKGEKIIYGWLGVSVQDLTDDLRNYFGIKETKGIIVVRVYKNSPAQISGLREGDLILSFDDKLLKTTRDLVRMVSFCEVGAKIRLRVVREGKEKNIDVKITSMSNEQQDVSAAPINNGKDFRGMIVEDITLAHQQQYGLNESSGVVITSLLDGSPAMRSGLMVSDVVVGIDNKEIKNKGDFVLVAAKIKKDCLVKTNRGFFIVKDK